MTELFASGGTMPSVLAMGDGLNFGMLLASLAVDLVAVALIMTLGYYRAQRNAGYLFTLILVNVLVFLVTHLMLVADLSAGVGFGMFALFGIMRFRTATLPILEMTYLFTAIVVAVINGVSVELLEAWELVLINTIAVTTVIALSGWAQTRPRTLTMLYDRIENLPPQRRPELIADLRERSGEAVIDVSVVRVNLLNDTAELSVTVETVNDDTRSDAIDLRSIRARASEKASRSNSGLGPNEGDAGHGHRDTGSLTNGVSDGDLSLHDQDSWLDEETLARPASRIRPVDSAPPAPTNGSTTTNGTEPATDQTPVGIPRPHLAEPPTPDPLQAINTQAFTSTGNNLDTQAEDPVEPNTGAKRPKRILDWTVGNQ